MDQTRPETDIAAERLPCDPAAVILPALSALGAIAAIAVVPLVGVERTPARGGIRRKPHGAVRDLETDCLQLQEIFGRLEKRLKSAPGGKAVAASPLKFGLYGVDLADTAMAAEIARVLGSAMRNSGDVMRAMEEGTVPAPEDLCLRFGECQEKLSKLVIERASVRVAIEEGGAIATRLTELVVKLKTMTA